MSPTKHIEFHQLMYVVTIVIVIGIVMYVVTMIIEKSVIQLGIRDSVFEGREILYFAEYQKFI